MTPHISLFGCAYGGEFGAHTLAPSEIHQIIRMRQSPQILTQSVTCGGELGPHLRHPSYLFTVESLLIYLQSNLEPFLFIYSRISLHGIF
jgi:hypothetical protein